MRTTKVRSGSQRDRPRGHDAAPSPVPPPPGRAHARDATHLLNVGGKAAGGLPSGGNGPRRGAGCRFTTITDAMAEGRFFRRPGCHRHPGLARQNDNRRRHGNVVCGEGRNCSPPLAGSPRARPSPGFVTGLRPVTVGGAHTPYVVHSRDVGGPAAEPPRSLAEADGRVPGRRREARSAAPPSAH